MTSFIGQVINEGRLELTSPISWPSQQSLTLVILKFPIKQERLNLCILKIILFAIQAILFFMI